jgi:hypothetical protein
VFGLSGHEIRLELDLGSVFDVIGATYKISTNMADFNFYKRRDDMATDTSFVRLSECRQVFFNEIFSFVTH